MDANRSTIRLLNLSPIECKEDIDERFEKCYNILQELIKGSSESEAHDTLMATVSKSNQDHDNVCLGLLTSILVDPPNAPRYYRDLTYVTRDGLNLVISCLNHIIIERYPKLHDACRAQLIWVLRELVKNSITASESIIISLLRQIAGGDISAKNIWLTEKMLDLLVENRSWLDKHSLLIAITVYTYLRLIVDHGGPNLTPLRQKEVDFCVSLLREKFTDCLVIGRDLVRLLQNVARIPEFDKLWKDIFNNPSSLAANFKGVEQLMHTRTSRRFLQCRLTPDMEKKILYLTSNVKFGQQRRYQEWFQRQYLSTPESQSLRCDLIRYICGVIHPSNEVLCSEIIPRWAIIGWILSSCTSNVAAANAKLSLFYDWLFYGPERDNIMNIEPAILVMFHSMRNHSVITVGLLDFLCRIVTHFCPTLLPQVKQGVSTSLQQILEKRVLPSLSSLFESPKLDPELRSLIRETFPEFCSSVNDGIHNSISGAAESLPIRDNVDIIIEIPPKGNHHNNDTNNDTEPQFSDDESESNSGPNHTPTATNTNTATTTGANCGSGVNSDATENKKSITQVREDDNTNNYNHETKKSSTGSQALTRSTFDSNVDRLADELKTTVISLEESKDNETRCELIEKILQLVLQDDEFSDESILAECVIYALRDELTKQHFPECPDEEALEESIGSPLFVIFRNLCQTPEENPNRVPILSLLAEMSTSQPSIGYLLLYYIKVSKSYDGKVSPYRDFAKSLGKDLKNCLLTDLKACQDYGDTNLFCYLIPDTYNHFPMIALNNPDLLHLIVSCIDSNQLQELVCLILQGSLTMFRKDGLVSLLNASLEWETFEQFCLWQLFTAHPMPVEYILPILPKLEFQKRLAHIVHGVQLELDERTDNSSEVPLNDNPLSFPFWMPISAADSLQSARKHAEALTNILLLLKRETPSQELLKHIIPRDAREKDHFVVSLLKYWTTNEHSEKLAELLGAQLTKPNLTKRKRPANNKVQLPTNAEQILIYLDQLRQTNMNSKFFTHESIQKALVSVQELCSEAQKSRFSDLFALIDDHDSKPNKRGKPTNKKTKSKQVEESNSDTEASEEESTPAKNKAASTPRKKRKTIVASDSD